MTKGWSVSYPDVGHRTGLNVRRDKMANILDESLNDFLKLRYGDSLFKKKFTLEITMELNSTKYEIKEVYVPEEEIFLKSK